jgi:hypothetical protein
MMSNNCNYNKVNCKTDIKRKQAMFNRFKRRYKSSKNPTEKKFLKTEATRVATDLKQWSKRWNTWGFGACSWITKTYSVSNFTCSRTSMRKSPTCKSTWKRTTSGRPKSGSSARTRTTGAHRSYSAW